MNLYNSHSRFADRRVDMTLTARLLMEHPFADADPLLHTVDRTVLAGEARGPRPEQIAAKSSAT